MPSHMLFWFFFGRLHLFHTCIYSEQYENAVPVIEPFSLMPKLPLEQMSTLNQAFLIDWQNCNQPESYSSLSFWMFALAANHSFALLTQSLLMSNNREHLNEPGELQEKQQTCLSCLLPTCLLCFLSALPLTSPWPWVFILALAALS